MQRQNVNVDVQTFGSLALVCDQLKDGLQLLKDMEVRTLVCYYSFGETSGYKWTSHRAT